MYYTAQEVIDFYNEKMNQMPKNDNTSFGVLGLEKAKATVKDIKNLDIVKVIYTIDKVLENAEIHREIKIKVFVKVTPLVFTDDRSAVDLHLATKDKLTLEEYFKLNYWNTKKETKLSFEKYLKTLKND